MTIEEILELTRAGYTKEEINIMSANTINPAPAEEIQKPEEGGAGSNEGKPEITPNQSEMDDLRKQLEAATQKIAEQNIQMEELKKSFMPNSGAAAEVKETTALDAVKAIFKQNL